MVLARILRVGRGCLLPCGGGSRLLPSSSAYSIPTTRPSSSPVAPRATAVTAPVSWDEVITTSVDEKENPLDLGRVASSAKVAVAKAVVRTENEVRRQPRRVVKEVPQLKAEVIKSRQVQLEGGDLRLGEFMEEVKTELWQYNAMPFRKRFKIQSLLR